MLGKKYRPSPGSDVRSAETIRSSFAIREKPTPSSSTKCERPPHTNTVTAPASVAISHLTPNRLMTVFALLFVERGELGSTHRLLQVPKAQIAVPRRRRARDLCRLPPSFLNRLHELE